MLSVDEKSQNQALDRTQPGLPLKKGRAGTMTHDYKRHGTTTLFAALDVATGKVIGECMSRHRHQEFLRFLRTIDRNTPKSLDRHSGSCRAWGKGTVATVAQPQGILGGMHACDLKRVSLGSASRTWLTSPNAEALAMSPPRAR